MTAVVCPRCKNPMEIDEKEKDTEWECPTCGAAFVVQGTPSDALQIVVTQESTRTPETRVSTNLKPGQMSPPQDDIDDGAVYALECLLKGQKPRDIRKRLINQGHSSDQADRILQTAIQFQRDNDRQPAATDGNSGQTNMLVGGLICLVGIIITFGSMVLAREGGGGRYVLAWGAIVFGAIQFFRGLSQSHHR